MQKAMLTCCLALPLLQGCSVHPLQQDVTGLRTVDLVDHIRCEARSAVERKAISLLETYGTDAASVIAAELKADPEKFRQFDSKRLDKMQLAFYKRYIKTAIAFNFTFDITEDDKATAQVDLLKPLTNGTFSLALGGSSDFSRDNARRFLVSDTFEELLNNPKLTCDTAPQRDNLIYPISGQIGLKEVIDTFVDLNEDKNLEFVDKAEVFADTLTFITTISASANPKVTFVPVGRGFQVLDSPLTSAASRIDKHSVIIGLSLGSSMEKSKIKAEPAGLGKGLIPNTAILSSDIGTATQRAISATINQRFDTFLDRFGDVTLRVNP